MQSKLNFISNRAPTDQEKRTLERFIKQLDFYLNSSDVKDTPNLDRKVNVAVKKAMQDIRKNHR